MKNIKLIIEYDGTNYCGWQKQNNGVSIEETIQNALIKVLKEDIKIIGAGRTDAGVHARGQVANFFTETGIPDDRIALAVNSVLPSDIVILKSEGVSMDFHSRYKAIGKRYSYSIINRRMPSAIMKNFYAHVPYDLNFEDMKSCIDCFLGTHDFSAFKSTGGSAKTSIRTIKYVNLVKDKDIIRFYIEGNGFLYNMVRIIAGTLIDVGRGKINPKAVSNIIESKDRKLAGITAPAKGLCLEKVYY